MEREALAGAGVLLKPCGVWTGPVLCCTASLWLRSGEWISGLRAAPQRGASLWGQQCLVGLGPLDLVLLLQPCLVSRPLSSSPLKPASGSLVTLAKPAGTILTQTGDFALLFIFSALLPHSAPQTQGMGSNSWLCVRWSPAHPTPAPTSDLPTGHHLPPALPAEASWCLWGPAVLDLQPETETPPAAGFWGVVCVDVHRHSTHLPPGTHGG